MNEIFKKIDEDKRDRIINSALEQFGKNGFEKASTNAIVKNANISKGLLFHYFKTKKELYDKLEEFVIQTVTDAISEKIDWNVTDFFERVKQIIMIKGELMEQYPYIYNFVVVMVETYTLDKLRQETEEQSAELIQRIYHHNIDFSMFRKDIDLEMAMTIIRWTFEKYGEELMKTRMKPENVFDYKQMEQEVENYIEVLKKAFYKEEVKLA